MIPINQNNEELAIRLEKRLDKIEEKLDRYLELNHKHEADITWVKGYIKLSISLIITILGGLVTTIVGYFTGKI